MTKTHTGNNSWGTLVCLKRILPSPSLQPYGVDVDPSEKRMATGRCAELMAIAIANRLPETWISQHPPLLFTYATQYAPGLSRWWVSILFCLSVKSYLHRALSPWEDEQPCCNKENAGWTLSRCRSTSCHWSYVTWASWCLDWPATRLFGQ